MSTDKSNAGKGGGVGKAEPLIVIGDGSSQAIAGGNGGDLLYGGSGNDTVNGNAGNDWVDAGVGDDTGIHDLRTDESGWDFYFGGAGTDTLEIRLSSEQFQDPRIRASLLDLQDFILNNKDGGNGNDYSHMGTFSALGLKAGGWENLRVLVDDQVIDLESLVDDTKGGKGGKNDDDDDHDDDHDDDNDGDDDHGDDDDGDDHDDGDDASDVIAVTTPDSNVNTSKVVEQWAEQGVHVRALVGSADTPSTWQDTAFGTKAMQFSITGANTSDASL
ncbi:MAG TPA: hypothetical protein VD995_24865, partial [Azospirillum sp.]|nr:hypothetical protein [Azospirillum sp.]